MKKNLTRPWTGKAEGPTNEKKKNAHAERVPKKTRLYELEEEDWEKELQEYYAETRTKE